MSDIKITIEARGQKYVDTPVFAYRANSVLVHVAEACGRRIPKRIFLGYERRHLKWVRPNDCALTRE